MKKKLLEIDGCSHCKYYHQLIRKLDGYDENKYCCHEESYMKLLESTAIPDWCPLDDVGKQNETVQAKCRDCGCDQFILLISQYGIESKSCYDCGKEYE